MQTRGMLRVPLAFLFWLGASAAGLLSVWQPAGAAPAPPSQLPEMYSDYRFGPKDRVLDIGIQPLWVPTSTITEAMKRDQVLGREMAKLGMRARFHPFRLGPEGNAFLGDDRLDGMLAGDMPALTAAASKDVVIVTLVHQGFGAIVAKGVKSVAGLRGKRVAYAPGSSTHFTLLRVLQLHGIRPEEVTLAPMVDLANQAEKLRTGEVAAISVWDPLTSALTKTVPGSVILHRSLFEGYMYFTRQAVERHPQAVRLIIAAQIRAMGWMRLSVPNLRQACQWALEGHQRFSGNLAPVTVEEYAALIKGTLLDVAPVPEIDTEQLEKGGAIQAKQEFLVSHGAIPRDTPFSKIKDSFDGRLVLDVTAESAKYCLSEYNFDGEVR